MNAFKIIHRPFLRISQFTKLELSLVEIIQKCLQVNPAQRWTVAACLSLFRAANDLAKDLVEEIYQARGVLGKVLQRPTSSQDEIIAARDALKQQEIDLYGKYSTHRR